MADLQNPLGYEPVPEPVHLLTEGCVQFVHKALGVALDYTQETLPVLDHYMTLVRERQKDEILALLAPACGAYFGEMVRRVLGDGRWYCPPDDYASWRLEFDRCFLHFNPVGVALETVIVGDAEGWSGHFQVLPEDRARVEDALERAGSVTEDDYYKFSVRFDVLQTIYDIMVAQAHSRGELGRRFGPDVYRAAVEGKARPSRPPN